MRRRLDVLYVLAWKTLLDEESTFNRRGGSREVNVSSGKSEGHHHRLMRTVCNGMSGQGVEGAKIQ